MRLYPTIIGEGHEAKCVDIELNIKQLFNPKT